MNEIEADRVEEGRAGAGLAWGLAEEGAKGARGSRRGSDPLTAVPK